VPIAGTPATASERLRACARAASGAPVWLAPWVLTPGRRGGPAVR
jgi:hypothetical protein